MLALVQGLRPSPAWNLNERGMKIRKYDSLLVCFTERRRTDGGTDGRMDGWMDGHRDDAKKRFFQNLFCNSGLLS